MNLQKVAIASGAIGLVALVAKAASASGATSFLNEIVPGTGTHDGADDGITHHSAIQSMIDRILSGTDPGWNAVLTAGLDGSTTGSDGSGFYYHFTKAGDVKSFVYSQALDVVQDSLPDAAPGNWNEYLYPGIDKYIDTPFKAIQREITRIISGVDGWEAQFGNWRWDGGATTSDALKHLVFAEALLYEAHKFDASDNADGKGTILDFTDHVEEVYSHFNYSGLDRYVGAAHQDSGSSFDWNGFWNGVVDVIDTIFGGQGANDGGDTGVDTSGTDNSGSSFGGTTGGGDDSTDLSSP